MESESFNLQYARFRYLMSSFVCMVGLDSGNVVDRVPSLFDNALEFIGERNQHDLQLRCVINLLN